MEEKITCAACEARKKHNPRNEGELKDLKTRINKIIGQLNGVQKMLDENRYCGDVLTQIAATESALQAVGYIVLKSHMESCLIDDIKEGKNASVDEVFDLMKKLK